LTARFCKNPGKADVPLCHCQRVLQLGEIGSGKRWRQAASGKGLRRFGTADAVQSVQSLFLVMAYLGAHDDKSIPSF
jgi:hypothetical protein